MPQKKVIEGVTRGAFCMEVVVVRWWWWCWRGGRYRIGREGGRRGAQLWAAGSRLGKEKRKSSTRERQRTETPRTCSNFTNRQWWRRFIAYSCPSLLPANTRVPKPLLPTTGGAVKPCRLGAEKFHACEPAVRRPTVNSAYMCRLLHKYNAVTVSGWVCTESRRPRRRRGMDLSLSRWRGRRECRWSRSSTSGCRQRC